MTRRIVFGKARDIAVQRDGRDQRQLERPPVHHGQAAGQAGADRASLGVGRRAKRRGTATEQFAGR